MKVLIRLSAVVFLLTVVMGTTSAQKLKFGHTNSQKLIDEMPETKKAKEELEALTAKYTTRFQEMQTEYQKKATEFSENEQLADASPEKWDDLTKEDKYSEIMGLQQRLQTYEASVQQKINDKQIELLTPISEKVQKAIKEVAEAGEYIYIFDESTLLYFSKTQSIDVTDEIKKKLAATE
ncbi:MAG: OmpH family outer membrane protein [Bacteroidales bacterium]|nr:OmpH family outer membrane protein [Bacteroidales bacterium]